MVVEQVKLGREGPMVSRFCFGMLPLSPLQSNLPRDEAAHLLEEALSLGVTFFDTAELYRTYPLVRDVLRPPAVVATKAYAYTYGGMRNSLRLALAETGRDHIDLFLLHEQESRLTLAGHAEALRCLVEAKRAGVVGAVGISTHAPEVVAAAAEVEDIDVIHPLLNHRGLGLLGGTLDEMLAAVAKAARAGKGIYAMKILGGGHLAVGAGGPNPACQDGDRGRPGVTRAPAGATPPAEQAFAFIRSNPNVHAVAVGVKSSDELRYDLALLCGGVSGDELGRLAARVAARPRGLYIEEEHCEGCGKCVEACRYGALSLVARVGSAPEATCAPAGAVPPAPAAGGAPPPAAGGAPAPAGGGAPPPAGGGAPPPADRRAVVDPSKCVLCGYCAAACRDFYIKVV